MGLSFSQIQSKSSFYNILPIHRSRKATVMVHSRSYLYILSEIGTSASFMINFIVG